MMATCVLCYPNECPECKCGERRKADAFALLLARRETVVRRAQRALLTVLLETGSATADDVRELVELPPGIGPKCFGAAPGPLARAGVICAAGFAKTCRPVGHARPVTVWALADRPAAERWLQNHPDLSDPADINESEGVAVARQGVLFGQESATPAAGTTGVV
jgi:hypothetical protein